MGLDVFRIAAAFVILLFHSATHINCNYGILQPFIMMGAVFMTGFFLLSGYSLFYAHGETDFSELVNVKQFYIKRAVGIMPLYYVVALLYILFLGKESLVQNTVIAPTEIMGIQSVFSSLFTVTHNGGTWFISCILLCYGIFPFVAMCIRQMTMRGKLSLFSLCTFVLLYAPFVEKIFHTQSIYSNPFFRILEFIMGCILASVQVNFEECKVGKLLLDKKVIFMEGMMLIVGISIAYKLGIARGNYMLYSWVCLPLFCLMIPALAYIKRNHKGDSIYVRIILYLSAISYSFFLAQFFVWPVMNILNIQNNMIKIILCIALCTVISILLHEFIEKPSKRFLAKIFQEGKHR